MEAGSEDFCSQPRKGSDAPNTDSDVLRIDSDALRLTPL